jgi:hypothetical protein
MDGLRRLHRYPAMTRGMIRRNWQGPAYDGKTHNAPALYMELVDRTHGPIPLHPKAGVIIPGGSVFPDLVLNSEALLMTKNFLQTLVRLKVTPNNIRRVENT